MVEKESKFLGLFFNGISVVVFIVLLCVTMRIIVDGPNDASKR